MTNRCPRSIENERLYFVDVLLIETVLAWALLERGEETRAGDLSGETVVRARAEGEVLALVDALRVQGWYCCDRNELTKQ